MGQLGHRFYSIEIRRHLPSGSVRFWDCVSGASLTGDRCSLENPARLARTASAATWCSAQGWASESGLLVSARLIQSPSAWPAAGTSAWPASRSPARSSGPARQGAGGRREHELPQLILALIFVNLDAWTFVGAGDTRDPADLVAAARYRGRSGLARIGQERIDESQRGVGRALCGTGLIPAARVRGLRRERQARDPLRKLPREALRLIGVALAQSLTGSRCHRHELAIRIDAESRRSYRLAWQRSWGSTPSDSKRSRSWCLSRYLSNRLLPAGGRRGCERDGGKSLLISHSWG